MHAATSAKQLWSITFSPGFSRFGGSSMGKAMKAKAIRFPLAAWEVHIIRRLKNIAKLPLTKIAIAVGRNKRTVYSALDKKWKASKRGRPELLTSKQVNLLVRRTRP